MILELDDVPPAIHLLLSLLGESTDWAGLRKSIRACLKDLQTQSIAYESSPERNPKKANVLHFEVHLHGGLDLFDGKGACADLECRLLAADRIIRSMGLIADRIWLTDFISEKFFDFGRATNEKIDRIIVDTFVLARLAPLIDAGIIRFRSPWRSACSNCLEHFEDEVDEISKEVTRKFAREAKFLNQDKDKSVLSTGRFFEPSLIYRVNTHEGPKPRLRDITESVVREQIRSAMWTSRDASAYGGSVFSNSRVGLSGILSQEGRFEDRKQLMLLDHDRAVQIPWVSSLNGNQILQLREEASNALPIFREKMAKTLTLEDNKESSTSKSKEFMDELREQAIEVRAELSVTQKSSARFWKSTYGLLGLGISAYGVAHDQVVPGVGGLLPLINLLINHASGSEKDLDKLTHRPGYVLVKAQDLLAHADH